MDGIVEGIAQTLEWFGVPSEVLRHPAYDARRPKNALPDYGPVDGVLQRWNQDTGELIQTRYYGPDGRPIRDIDYNHDHGAGIPHVHDWYYPSPQAPNPVRGKAKPFN